MLATELTFLRYCGVMAAGDDFESCYNLTCRASPAAAAAAVVTGGS